MSDLTIKSIDCTNTVSKIVTKENRVLNILQLISTTPNFNRSVNNNIPRQKLECDSFYVDCRFCMKSPLSLSL